MCVFADVDGEDVELPPVVQDELRATFRAEKQALLAQVEALAAEAAQSQHAFDTYRERAKQSLLKSVAEQRAAEDNIASIRAQLQVTWNVYRSLIKEGNWP